MRRAPAPHLVFAGICLVALLAAALRNAWLCDDAFITFRSVDNLLNGYGMVWNVGERVQAFTHPLWFFLLSAVGALTGNILLAAFVLGLVGTALAIVMIFGAGRFLPATVLLTTTILGLSVCFNTFATSGLENPLSHILLVGLFLSVLRLRDEASPRDAFWPALAFGLLYLSRPDGTVLALPLCLYGLYRVWSPHRTSRNAIAVLSWSLFGVLPVLIWTAISLFYFGSPFPNTAYAKLSHDIPRHELFRIGWAYVTNPIRHDPVTASAVIAGLATSVVLRTGVLLSASAGILLHLGYLVKIGGDFMAGRHLTLTLVLAVLILTQLRLPPVKKLAPLMIPVVLMAPIAWFGAVEFSPEKLKRLGPTGIIEERDAWFHISSFWRWLEDENYPSHGLAHHGRELRKEAGETGSLIVDVQGAIGMVGYFAGPGVHIIDFHALADPLLARLPAQSKWRPGHFRRDVPCGYADTVLGVGELTDPDLATYYGALHEIISGDLLSPQRLRLIWQFNTGQMDRFKESYLERAVPEESC